MAIKVQGYRGGYSKSASIRMRLIRCRLYWSCQAVCMVVRKVGCIPNFYRRPVDNRTTTSSMKMARGSNPNAEKAVTTTFTASRFSLNQRYRSTSAKMHRNPKKRLNIPGSISPFRQPPSSSHNRRLTAILERSPQTPVHIHIE